MRTIGITGGVGAGKSTVLAFLEKKYDANVIQADEVGHLVMEPGEECYEPVIRLFGKDVIKNDKTIDRKRVSDVVFGQPDMLEQLNGIIHPAVKRYILRSLKEKEQQGCKLCIVEAALFLEEHYEEFCDEVWYVHTDEEIRIQRLMENRGYTREKSLGIIRNQASVEYFRAHTDYTVENNGDLEETWKLTGNDIDAILVTHEHSDHVSGLGVMARRYHIPVYTTGGTADAISRMKNMQKLPEDTFHEIEEDQDFHIKDLTIHPFSIPHDAAQPVGYRLECQDKAVGVATDLGKYNEYIVDNLQNLDALLLEANHDIRMLQVGSYPYYLKQRILGDRGHLSNENAGRLLCRLLHDDMKAIFLGHLSKENNYEALAYETVCSEVTLGDNPYKSKDFKIQVAKRDSISDVVML